MLPLAGGLIVLSNATKLPTILGTMDPSKDINDWTNTQIDQRDVWSTIFNDLFDGIVVKTSDGHEAAIRPQALRRTARIGGDVDRRLMFT